MEKSHYLKVKHFIYYALILHEDLDYVYVGKTSEKDLTNTFSRHVCGRVAATNAFFDKESRPKLYLLEECDETTAQGYKRVVAYVHMFLSEGYCCINHAGTIKHIRYVYYRLMKEVNDIQNLRGYILARLYEAADVMDSYFAIQVNHDLFNEKKEKYR